MLRGLGMVSGLKGTGDSGTDEVLARPLAEVYRNNGFPVPDIKALNKAKSVALVALEVVVPEQGAKVNDKLDVHVTVMHSASSLDGGRLYIGPLTGPYKGDTNVYAMASGPIELEYKQAVTVGRVRGGARVTRDILPPALGPSFDLICHPDVRGWTVTNQLADAINALQPDTDIYGESGIVTPPIARAIDESTVRVDIPAAERANPSRFVSKVLTANFSPTLPQAAGPGDRQLAHRVHHRDGERRDFRGGDRAQRPDHQHDHAAAGGERGVAHHDHHASRERRHDGTPQRAGPAFRTCSRPSNRWMSRWMTRSRSSRRFNGPAGFTRG